MNNMKYISIIVVLVVSIVIMNACIDDYKASYQRINGEQAKQMIDTYDVIILDVRTSDEYNSGHIANAMLLPVNLIKDQAEENLPDKDTIILIYCRSGNRSRTAAYELINLGYTNVYDFGGIIDWQYEIVE